MLIYDKTEPKKKQYYYLIENDGKRVQRIRVLHNNRKSAQETLKYIKFCYIENGWEILKTSTNYFDAKKMGVEDEVAIFKIELE